MVKYSRTWWMDVADRAWRQARQIVVPILIVIAAGGAGGVEWTGTGLAVAAGALWTLGRAITGARVPDYASRGLRLLDRAVSAAVGAVLGLGATVLQAAAGGSWPGFLDALSRLDGRAVVGALLGA